jgi:3-deoxy-7-phosphoheptulonate synthase
LTLITRFGCGKVEALLPPLVRAVIANQVPVLWVCDPCHGNTVVSASKVEKRAVWVVLVFQLCFLRFAAQDPQL